MTPERHQVFEHPLRNELLDAFLTRIIEVFREQDRKALLKPRGCVRVQDTAPVGKSEGTR